MNKTSNYKGVFWNSQHQKWRAKVQNYELGYFNTELEAVKARDKKIIALNLKQPLQIFKKL